MRRRVLLVQMQQRPLHKGARFVTYVGPGSIECQMAPVLPACLDLIPTRTTQRNVPHVRWDHMLIIIHRLSVTHVRGARTQTRPGPWYANNAPHPIRPYQVGRKASLTVV